MVVYKTFKTPLGKYVYDRNTNSLIKISDDEYQCIEEGDFDSSLIGTLKAKGYLRESIIEEIEHPFSNNVEHFLNHRIFHVILQVTQNCNLRCAYCAYSGNYEHRTHKNLRMSFETAKKAIDILAENSVENQKVALSFYGGEPTLEMDLIKKCVNYANNRIKDKNLVFSITTNGTLLTDSNIKFFKDNDFIILISLDGTKEDHDVNRKFINGEGSFDVIMENVKKIKEKYPDYMKKISFNAVLNPESNYSCVRDYFLTNEVVYESNYMLNTIVSEHRKEDDISFGDSFYLARAYDYFLFLMSMLNKCDKKHVPKAVLDEKVAIHSLYDKLREINTIGKKCHHGGPCIPGENRIFVSVSGEMYPCEKVPEIDTVCIGHIDSGFDIPNIKNMMNIGKISEKQCKKCWAFMFCTQCVNQVVEHGCFSLNTKLKYCNEAKEIALRGFEQILLLREMGYSFSEEAS